MKTGIQEHYKNTKTYEGRKTSIMATTNDLLNNVLAVMPHKVINKISGEPTYSAMLTWFKQIFMSLIAVKIPQDWGRGKGNLGILQAPAVFHAQNGDFYNLPPNAPLEYPNILSGANTGECKCLRAEHKVFYVHWAKYVHTGSIEVNIGAATFDKWVIAALEDTNEGLNRFTNRDVYDYIMGNYATISQTEVDANLDTFNKPADASRNLAVYICEQELCQEMAKDAHVSITEATMVAIGTKHAAATSGMDDA